jgi:hypothetical protein
MCYRQGEVSMSNVSYQVDRIDGETVHIIETFDLTKRHGPGILTRFGQIVDCQREGIISATRRIAMPVKQAVQLGIVPAED